MSRCRTARVLSSVFAVFAACAAPPVARPAAELHATLVVLKTGPRTAPLTDAERVAVFGGHFANMERLAKAGWLLVAGPFGKQKSDPQRRGLFVLDTADRGRATGLAESDPGFAAEVFTFEYHDLATRAPLRSFLAAELEARAAAEAAGRPPAPGEGGRLYVTLTASNGEAALAALQRHPAALLLARLDGTQGWAVLDARSLGEAQALLAPLRERLGPCVLDEWFASGRLAELPLLRP